MTQCGTVCHNVGKNVAKPRRRWKQIGTELQVYKGNQKLQLGAERVRECRSSGMKVPEWCEANGISKYT
ncbi:MAG: hypothetical protein IJI83_02160 [Oscillospiraceae bacterium]|nr:hypothetical protein [Oscillospiraceae bacterium]